MSIQDTYPKAKTVTCGQIKKVLKKLLMINKKEKSGKETTILQNTLKSYKFKTLTIYRPLLKKNKTNISVSIVKK